MVNGPLFSQLKKLIHESPIPLVTSELLALYETYGEALAGIASMIVFDLADDKVTGSLAALLSISCTKFLFFVYA